MDTTTSIFSLFDFASDESEAESKELPTNDLGFNETRLLHKSGGSSEASSANLLKLNDEHSGTEIIEKLCREESNDLQSDEIILSVYWKRGKLGAAYYVSSDSEIYLLNDVVDVHPDFNNLKTFVAQVNPNQVITCGGMPDAFVEVLSNAINIMNIQNVDKYQLQVTSSEEEQKPIGILFMSTRKKDLNYESCKRYILGMKFGFEPPGMTEEDHILLTHFHMDLNKEAMVISMGMLLRHLEKYIQEVNLNHEPLQIMHINYVSIDNLVFVDDITYKALQIFNPRVHPSAFKRNTFRSTMEGLSLFAIFNRCKSKIGIKKMREIFMNPSKNIEELNERLDAVEFCCKPQYRHEIQNLLNCIKKVKNITGILRQIYRTRASIGNWRSLYSSLYNTILIGSICRKHSSHCALLFKVADSITPGIHEAAHYMNQIIDFEESLSKNHFTVRSGVDKKLDLLRETYLQIPDVLMKVAEVELKDLPSFIEECSIIYITELGYLLSVPIWKGDGSDADDYTLPNFDVKFIVNNYVHYKTPRCAELDEVLGDTLASISDIESTIMITLIEFIHSKTSEIVKAIKLVAELDCAIAFSIVAAENNYRRPVLTQDRKIKIIEGQHPLQELCVDNFVPNDADFGTDKNLVQILTGPNASGKSVYLKQVALIAFMAHIGSFVPAQKAEICILDHIHTRIQTVESVSTRLSSFLLDLKQMSLSLYNSTPKSLIVIDEFGKGTTEIDGLSLLAASLIHFLERGSNCPFVLVSTHFHSLPDLLPSTDLLSLKFMDYMIEKEEIVYLHKIKIGVSGSSMTLLAAKAAGLSEDIIKRSLEIQFSNEELKYNPKLKITQVMLKEIEYMEKLIKLAENDENTDSKVLASNEKDVLNSTNKKSLISSK